MKIKLSKTSQEQKFEPFTIEIESDEFKTSKLEDVYNDLDAFMREKIQERKDMIKNNVEFPKGW